MCNDYVKIRSEAKDKSKYGEGLTILSPKQMLQRLSIALAEVKAGINSEIYWMKSGKLFILCINHKNY